MDSGTKNEKKTRPKLSLLSGTADAGLSPSLSPSLSNLEKFQEMIQDIVSFELKASSKSSGNAETQPDSTPISLTRARVAGLESIRLDTPGKVIRMINNDSEDRSDIESKTPHSPKNGKKK